MLVVNYFSRVCFDMAGGNSIELSTLRCHAFQERLRSQPRYLPVVRAYTALIDLTTLDPLLLLGAS